MLWNQRPTLVVGDETLCSILSKRIMDRGAYVYYWAPVKSRFDMTYSSRMQIVDRDLSSITGSEKFIRRSSLIFYMLSSEYLERNYEETLEFIRKITNSIAIRVAKIIVTIPMEECKVDLTELIEVFSKNTPIIGSIVVLPSIYGPKIERGIIYEALKQLKNNPYNIKVEASPYSVEEFIYIEDAMTAITKLLNKIKRFEVYRLNGDKIRVSSLIRRLLAMLGLDGITEVKYTGKILRKNRKLIELSKKLEWFKPSIEINDGLRRTIDWFEATHGPILVCPRNNLKNQ